MKLFHVSSLLLLVLLCVVLTHAQVTNLKVNGVTTPFSIMSGDQIQWEYDVPPGDTAQVEIYLDLNGNGTIDPGADVLFEDFPQRDGGSMQEGGPPDMDGMANGHIIFGAQVGLVPAAYVMRFTHHGTGQTAFGTVTPLASPAHTISGRVTVPAGESAQYILVQASREDSYNPSMWVGMTDVNGDYSIQMDADTAGNPWHLRLLRNPFPGSLLSPSEINITITSNHTGYNFLMQKPAAKVVGYVTDEFHNPRSYQRIRLTRADNGNSQELQADQSGFYEAGILSAELAYQWVIGTATDGEYTGMELQAIRNCGSLTVGDSLVRNLVVYAANSQIQGQVRVNGGAPGFPVRLIAYNPDSVQASTDCDPSTGYFAIPVTDKIYNYSVFAINLPMNSQSPGVLAHPGSTDVTVQVTMTGIAPETGGAPVEFALGQNYPNPFNPSTTIPYSLPHHSRVSLKVYSILGQMVARLVDGEQEAGLHTARFDASRLSTGVYFYRLEAGAFTQTKALIIMK